jgi:uncharacterized membrane protein YciS (DUF1049 family)
MIGLGIFILLVVGLASLAVVFRGGQSVHIDMHWFTINTSVAVVFLAGAVALALVVFGLSLLYEGLKRGHRRRKETKDLRKQVNANQTAPSAVAGSSSSEVSGPTSGSNPLAGSPRSTASPGPDDHFDSAPRER